MRRSLCLLALCGVLLGACRVDVTFAVAVRSDGSGTVTVAVHLDRQAIAALTAGGIPLRESVRFADVEAAGWTVSWTHVTGSPPTSAELVAVKPFARVGDVAGIAREIGGPNGPLRAMSVSRDATFTRTRWRFDATVDLRAVTVGVASDPALADALRARGVDPATVDQRLAGDLRQALGVRVVAELPARGPAGWDVRTGTRRSVTVDSSEAHTGRVLWLGAAIVCGVAAVALIGVGESRTRARRRRAARTTPERG